jgi:hypothetical protein
VEVIMSVEKLRGHWKRVAPFAVGLAVLGAVGVGVAERYGLSCCGLGAACCHPGSPCCHGHAPKA